MILPTTDMTKKFQYRRLSENFHTLIMRFHPVIRSAHVDERTLTLLTLLSSAGTETEVDQHFAEGQLVLLSSQWQWPGLIPTIPSILIPYILNKSAHRLPDI